MNQNNDNSKILYWNNSNILMSEKNVYINNTIIEYENITKIVVETSLLHTFLYFSPDSLFKTHQSISYHIFLENGKVFEAFDLLDYYKSDFISITDIIKNKNNNIIIIRK